MPRKETDINISDQITITLEEGTFDRTAFAEEFAALDAKYQAVAELSRYQPDQETPLEYQARLLKLYPEPAQQAYINALWTFLPVFGENSIEVANSLVTNQGIPDKLRSIFSDQTLTAQTVLPELLTSQNTRELRLFIQPEVLAEVISVANVTAFHLHAAHKQNLDRYKALFREMILTQKSGEALSAKEKLIVIRNQALLSAIKTLVGEKMVETEVNKFVDDHVTAETLGLGLPGVIHNLLEMSKEVSDGYNPLEAYANLLLMMMIADELDIWPKLQSEIRKVLGLELLY